jgi:hypothetical protein
MLERVNPCVRVYVLYRHPDARRGSTDQGRCHAAPAAISASSSLCARRQKGSLGRLLPLSSHTQSHIAAGRRRDEELQPRS